MEVKNETAKIGDHWLHHTINNFFPILDFLWIYQNTFANDAREL